MNEDLLRSISKSLFEAFASINATNNVSAGNAANNVKREDKNMSRRSITLGTWNGKPIEWLVLKEEGLATLVISRYTLFSHCFDNNHDNRWCNSSLRNYLNNEFYTEAFNEEEKKRIVNAYLASPDGTKDNVFVLSKEEADLLSPEERKFGNGNCNVSCCWDNCWECCCGNYENYSTCWILRTVYDSNNNNVYRVCRGGNYGSLPVNKIHSVRPSVWIKEQE